VGKPEEEDPTMANRYGVNKDGKTIATYDTEAAARAAAPGYGVDPKAKSAIVELTEEQAAKADGVATPAEPVAASE
jgi:hypothetical protein